MIEREAAEIESIGPDTLRNMSTQIAVYRDVLGVAVDGGESLGDAIYSFVATYASVASDPV